MTHPFQLTGTLWRQAATEVVRLRHTRSNHWIAEEANCSPLTVKNIRLELEQAGEIPYLDRLERKGGGMVLREFNRDKDRGDPGQADGTGQDVTAGTSSLSLGGEDFLDQEEEERTGENQRDRRDSDSTAARQPESTPERERSKSQHPEDRSGDAALGSSSRSNGFKGGKQKQQTLKFVPGEADALPAEVIIYVNGSPQSIPVTIMFAQGAIAGIPETSLEDYQRAVLVVDVEIGKQRGLVF